MKAIVCKKSGSPDVLKLEEISKPTPKPNEICVKVYASSVTRGDVKLRIIPRFILSVIGLMFGFKAMQVPGVEFAGEVESVGENVKDFKKGDQVFGTTTGLRFGGNAQYVCVPEKSKTGVVTKKPENISFSDATVIPVGGMTALYLLRKGNIKKDQKILIYGASGSVGSYAVQLAKFYRAKITAVCSTNNIDLVRSIGADEVIDYTKEVFTERGTEYDIIFDAVGKISKSRCKDILVKNGTYISVKSPTKERLEDLLFLKKLIKEEEIKPIIDREYTLQEVVDAHRYVEGGHKKGNVVIKVEHSNHQLHNRL
ncbi:MAG: NAD(P)-dependent alcohol dehydrogenase [Anaerobacillus sp.]|uniref:NAD(P)-dependent alcohol dehydrogenase n=1 Tax=Anaerobacillus sp. TaxID=1872506 RepID=UPI003919AFE7